MANSNPQPNPQNANPQPSSQANSQSGTQSANMQGQQQAVQQSTFDRIQDLKARRDKIVEEIAARNSSVGSKIAGVKGENKTSKGSIKAVKEGLNSSDAHADADLKALLEELLKIIEEIKELVKKHFHENLGSLTAALGINKNKAFGELNQTFKQIAQNIDEGNAIQAYTMEQMLSELRDVKATAKDLTTIKDRLQQTAENIEIVKSIKVNENNDFYNCFYRKMRDVGITALKNVEKVLEELDPNDERTIKLREALDTFQSFKSDDNYNKLIQALQDVKAQTKSTLISRDIDATIGSLDKASKCLKGEMEAYNSLQSKEKVVASCQDKVQSIKEKATVLEGKVNRAKNLIENLKETSRQTTDKDKINALNTEIKQQTEIIKSHEGQLETLTAQLKSANNELEKALKERDKEAAKVKVYQSGKMPDSFVHDFAVKSQLISYGREDEYFIAYRGQLIKASIGKPEGADKFQLHLEDSGLDYDDFIQGGRLAPDKEKENYLIVKDKNNSAEYILSKIAEKNGTTYTPSQDALDQIYAMSNDNNSAAIEFLIQCYDEPQNTPDGKFTYLAKSNDENNIEFIVKDNTSGQRMAITLTDEGINITTGGNGENAVGFGYWEKQENGGMTAKYMLTKETEPLMYMMELPIIQDYLATLGISKEAQERSLVSKVQVPFEKVDDTNLGKVQKLYDHLKNEASASQKDLSIKLNNLENSTTIDIVKDKMQFSIAFDKEGNPFTVHFDYDYTDGKSHNPILLSHRGMDNFVSFGSMQKLFENPDMRDIYKIIGSSIKNPDIVEQYKSQEAMRNLVERIENESVYDADRMNRIADFKASVDGYRQELVDRGISDISDTEIKQAYELVKAIEIVSVAEEGQEKMSKSETAAEIGRVLTGQKISDAKAAHIGNQYLEHLENLGLYDGKTNTLAVDLRDKIIEYAVDVSSRNEASGQAKVSANALGYLAEVYSDSFNDSYIHNEIYHAATSRYQEKYDEIYSSEEAKLPLRIREAWEEQTSTEHTNLSGLEGQARETFFREYRKALDLAMSKETISLDDIRGITESEGHAHQMIEMLQRANIIVGKPVGQYESNTEYKVNTAKTAEYDATKKSTFNEIRASAIKPSKKEEVGRD